MGALLAPMLALVGGPDLAQGSAPPVSQSPTVDRDRLDRVDPTIPRAGAPAQLPAAPVSIDAATPAQVALRMVRYEGASLSSDVLDVATRPFIDTPITRDMLQKLANAVSAAYAKSDIAFYAVSIPAQSAADGVLTLRVVEGRIVQYALAGETKSTPKRLIDAHVQRLMRDPMALALPINKLGINAEFPGFRENVHVLSARRDCLAAKFRTALAG